MAQEELNTMNVIVENRSVKTYGIFADGEWINFESTSEAKTEEIKTLIADVNRGDVLKLTMASDGVHYTDFEIIKRGEPQQDNGKKWNDDGVSFAELLKRGHNEGVKGWNTEEIMHDPVKKVASFKCTIYKQGKEKQCVTYTAHGDASLDNVNNDKIAKHYYRMAETRAISRAHRFALGEGTVCEDEKE